MPGCVIVFTSVPPHKYSTFYAAQNMDFEWNLICKSEPFRGVVSQALFSLVSSPSPCTLSMACKIIIIMMVLLTWKRVRLSVRELAHTNQHYTQ